MPGRILTPGACGVFGKLPSAGDFLRLNVSAVVAGALDAWLEGGFAGLEAADLDWRDAFPTAPAWRFFVEAGLLGPDALVGVIRPSMDAAGRLFPVAAVAASNVVTREAALAAPAWFDAVEGALMTAAAPEAADAFAALGPLKTFASSGLTVRTRRTADGLFIDAEGAADPRAEALAAVVEAAQPPPASSLWWRHADGRTRLVVTAGLPRGQAFAALFRGPAAPAAAPQALEANAA